MIGNNDLHLKNIAILTADGISVSPIFDFVSTQLIDYEPDINLTLSMNGRDRKLRRKDWFIFANDLGLTPAAVAHILNYFQANIGLMESVIKRSFLYQDYQQKLITFIKERMEQSSF